jgi:DNA-directed RNA polymerase specialized sigma24 family protein
MNTHRKRGPNRTAHEGGQVNAEDHTLRAMAAGLPDDVRRVLTLRKVYDMTPAAIQQQLAMSAAEVERCLITAALAFGAAPGSSSEAPQDPP